MTASNDTAPGYLAGVLERLIERCAEGRGPEMAAARVELDERRGRVFEDEDEWEGRTAMFLEHWALERRDPETGLTPAASAADALADSGEAASDAERERRALIALARSYRCLGEVIDIDEGVVTIADTIGGAHIEITERRGLPGVSVGDIAELRIIAFEGAVYLGSQIVWHPPGTRDALLAHVEALVAEGVDREAICDFASSLLVRSKRYAHIEPASVYAKVTRPT